MLTMGCRSTTPTPNLKMQLLHLTMEQRSLSWPALNMLRIWAQNLPCNKCNIKHQTVGPGWPCECHSASERWKVLTGSIKLGVSVSSLPVFLNGNICLALVTKIWTRMTIPASVLRTDISIYLSPWTIAIACSLPQSSMGQMWTQPEESLEPQGKHQQRCPLWPKDEWEETMVCVLKTWLLRTRYRAPAAEHL